MLTATIVSTNIRDPAFLYFYFSFSSGSYSLWLYLLQSIHTSLLLAAAAARCYINAYRTAAGANAEMCRSCSPCLCVFVVRCHPQWFNSSSSSDPRIPRIHRNSLVKHIFQVFTCCYLSQEFCSNSIGIRTGN